MKTYKFNCYPFSLYAIVHSVLKMIFGAKLIKVKRRKGRKLSIEAKR